MAIEKEITAEESADGRQVEGSYWTPVQINIGVLDENGLITFYGHASRTARGLKKAPIPGAVRNYSFDKTQFNATQMIPLTTFFPEWTTLKLRDVFEDRFEEDDENGDITLAEFVNAQPLKVFYDVLARFAYGTAKNRKDVPVLDEEGNPVLDEDEKPVMRSFFDGAEDA